MKKKILLFLKIVKSRFRKDNNNDIEDWILDRRKQCKVCKYNTKNLHNLPLKKQIVKWFSDFYSFITGNKDKDILGNCSACEMCSIYYKTKEIDEYCPKEKWKD